MRALTIPGNGKVYNRNFPRTVHRFVLCAGGIFYGKREYNENYYNIQFKEYDFWSKDGTIMGNIYSDNGDFNIPDEDNLKFYNGNDVTTIPEFMCDSYTTGTARITIYNNVPLEYQTEKHKSCFNSKEAVFPAELNVKKIHDWRPYQSSGNYCGYYGQKSLMFDEMTGHYTYSYAMIAGNFI